MKIQLKEIFDQLNIIGNVSVAHFSIVFREVPSKDAIRYPKWIFLTETLILFAALKIVYCWPS